MFLGSESLEEIIALICLNKKKSASDFNRDVCSEESLKIKDSALKYIESLSNDGYVTEYNITMAIKTLSSVISALIHNLKDQHKPFSKKILKSTLKSLYDDYHLKIPKGEVKDE